MGNLGSKKIISEISYIRDRRSPVPGFRAVSQVMRANKAKNTTPEIALRKKLWLCGLRNYRLHKIGFPGRPDIVFPKKKLAIFVNGCYWHHCPKCDLPLPKNNRLFWKAKFERNQARDRQKITELKKLGWTSIVVWEHETKKNIDKAVTRILRALT